MVRIPLLLFALLIFVPLNGCSLKVGAIRSVDATANLDSGKGIVAGRVRHIVDGRVMKYSLLSRPVMRLFRFSDGQYYETPMVDADGAFAWMLPEGEYEIAVLGGGMSPTGQPMLMRNTSVLWQVNGFAYPGYLLSVAARKTHYLGTIEIDVNSRKMKAVIDLTGERVFRSLNRIRIIDESAFDPGWQALKDRPQAVIRLIEPLAR